MRAPRATLGAGLETRENSTYAVRLGAALGVLVAHAWLLSIGSTSAVPLLEATSGQADLGRVSVAVFFVLSGSLIVRSWEHSPRLPRFLQARVLRLWPALGVVLLASAFILGPLITTLPLATYLRSREVWVHVLRNLVLVRPHWTLPGVFAGLPCGPGVNGSLWTLRYEAAMYLLVALAGLVGILRPRWVLAGLLVSALVPYVPRLGPWLGDWPELASYFGGGALLYLGRHRIRRSPGAALLAVALLVATARLGMGFKPALAIAGGYLVLYAASSHVLAGLERWGDWSYGVYLWGFPMQQLILYLFGGRCSPWVCLAVSLPVVLGLGALSWHLVERRALALKQNPPAKVSPPLHVAEIPQ